MPPPGVGILAAGMAFVAVMLNFSLHKIEEGQFGVHLTKLSSRNTAVSMYCVARLSIPSYPLLSCAVAS